MGREQKQEKGNHPEEAECMNRNKWGGEFRRGISKSHLLTDCLVERISRKMCQTV